jgi:hypothetical protein
VSLLCICSSRCTAWSRKVGSHIVRWAMATYVTPLEAQFTRAIDRPWMAYVAIVLDDTSLPEKGQPFGGATVFSNGRGWCAFAENGVEDNEELIPSFDGAVFSQEWKDALWARFSMGAPRRQRRSVERYRIVMSGRRPLIKGLIPAMGDRGCGNVSGLLMQSYDRWPRWCPLICWLDPESELEVPVVLGLRLFLPESWTNDVERMVAAACRSFSRRRAPSPGAPFRRSTGHGARRALRPGAGRCRLRPVRVLPTGPERPRPRLGRGHPESPEGLWRRCRARLPRRRARPAPQEPDPRPAFRARRGGAGPSPMAQGLLAAGTKGPLSARFAACRIRIADAG